jgi:hypothetical protein
MLIKVGVAIAAVLAIGFASAATAAPRVHKSSPMSAYRSFDSAPRGLIKSDRSGASLLISDCPWQQGYPDCHYPD